MLKEEENFQKDKSSHSSVSFSVLRQCSLTSPHARSSAVPTCSIHCDQIFVSVEFNEVNILRLMVRISKSHAAK